MQPSTSAASSSSIGIDMKKPIRSQVQNGIVKPMWAIVSPVSELVSPTPTMIANSGMNSSDCGTR